MDELKNKVITAKQHMINQRKLSDEAALKYRESIHLAVQVWRAEGVSLRKCAERLGITLGALNDLLRPLTQARRKGKRNVETSDDNS